MVGGRMLLSGNGAFMRENGISTSVPEADTLFRQGKSIVYYANENRVIGLIALAVVAACALALVVPLLSGYAREAEKEAAAAG